MTNNGKQLSNPISTGGGGGHFEAHVQASFVILMLAGGVAPCMPNKPIDKIRLQGKVKGYQTDDLIVYVKEPNASDQFKMLAQIKHSIKITKANRVFAEVIQSAWQDFNNPDLFSKNKDIIGLITGPLSATDTNDVRSILEWARYSENASDFFAKVETANFSSKQKRDKLAAFKANLKKANAGTKVSEDEVFDFLQHFHLIGYDLDIKAGVTLALLHSFIGQYSPGNAEFIWAKVVDEVQSANKNAGTISLEQFPKDLIDAFRPKQINTIPKELMPEPPDSEKLWKERNYVASLSACLLVGKWNEQNENDVEIIRKLIDGF